MDKPGTRRLIRPQDLPTADQAHSATNFLYHVARSERQRPSVPTGFDVKLFASGLSHQRLIRVAPNGDVFAAESEAGRIRVLRPNGGQSAAASIFADGLHGPFGIAFYPPGHDPSCVYVGNTDSVVRFAYRSGDLKARAPAESIVPRLPTGGSHRTRDVVFSPDGRTMYVSVGSASNVGDGMKKLSAAELHAWQSTQPLGAAWGNETDRAAVLAFDPEGKNKRIFATGIRNCVGMAVAPASGELWCSTNSATGSATTCRPTTLRTCARHGSWNRSKPTGYKVIRVILKDGVPTCEYEDFATGFVIDDRELWGRPVGVARAAFGALPAVHFTETDRAYEITSELPSGMDEKNVEVKFAKGVLTIKGEKQEEREEKKKGYHMQERSFGSFERTFQVPEGIDTDKIRTRFMKGALAVTLPKDAEAQVERKVAVKAG